MYIRRILHRSRYPPSAANRISNYLKNSMKYSAPQDLARPMLRKSQASNKQLTENIMSTYTRNLIAENGIMVAIGFGRIAAGKGRKVTVAAKGEETQVRHVKNVALFFAAPFIGLAYLVALPVVGLALLMWIAGKAAMKNEKARPIALLIAAPAIAIAFATGGPIFGLGAIACTGCRALLNV